MEEHGFTTKKQVYGFLDKEIAARIREAERVAERRSKAGEENERVEGKVRELEENYEIEKRAMEKMKR